MLIAAALLTGCLDGLPSPNGGGPREQASDNTAPVQASDNNAPQISGDPQYIAVEGYEYGFTPSTSDEDGDSLTFTIENKPTWAAFDEATGQLQGIPQVGDAGAYDGIVISVSDGRATASMPAFSIAVSRDELGAVTLEWQPPQSNTDGSFAADLGGYVVYWGTEPGNYDQQLRIDNVGLTAYVVDSLRPATYYFAATAFNSAGIESDFSNEVMRSVVVN